MMKKIFSFLVVTSVLFGTKIAFAESNFQGKFKIYYGNPNTSRTLKQQLPYSTINVSDGYKFSEDSDQTKLKTGEFLVQTNGAVDFMEITDFSPKISGFGPFNAILTTGLIREEKKVTANCKVTYVVGSNTNPKYSDEISVMNLMGHGDGPSQLPNPMGKALLDTHHSFHLNSNDSKTKKSYGDLTNPYFIKSLKVSCNKPVLTGFSPRLEAYYEQSAAPTGSAGSDAAKKADASK